MIKRNLPLNKIVVSVKPDEDKYMACIFLSDMEMKSLQLNVKDLQKILVSREKQILGLTFAYEDNNLEKRKDTLISRPLVKTQIMKFDECLPDNAYVVVVNDEGVMLDAKQAKLEIR